MPTLRVLLVSLLMTAVARAGTIHVGAAISLKDAFTDIAKIYTADTGEKVEFNFGSSGQVLTQLRSGADMDVFVSAANQQVDELVKDKAVDAATRRVVTANTLVLIVPPDADRPSTGLAALGDARVAKIAVGEPKTVPAGLYAKQVFAALKLTDAVAPKLVYGANVRQVLTYVERGEVSAGLVYATDAKQSGDKVRVVATADESTHEPIVYPGVVVTASKQRAEAKKFLDYLAGDAARAVFAAKGFVEAKAPAAK